MNNRDWLERKATAEAAGSETELALQFAFDRDGFYETLADKLLNKTSFRRRWHRRHWLCCLLNNCANACQTGTYIDLVKDDTVRVLHSGLGIPRVVAAVLAEALVFGAKFALSPTIVGPASLPLTLRALIPLICPKLGRCPTRADVLKTFAGPAIGRSLRAAVENSRP